jgi:hypothetical protein
MTEFADHNAADWLVVRWLAGAQGPGSLAGWYVVRCCPCHWGMRVTLPYANEARAERVRRILLGEVSTPSQPRLVWKREKEPA